MAITFLQKKKIQRTLILVFLGVLFVTGVVLWRGFYQTGPAQVPEPVPTRQIQVNTNVLDHSVFEELREPDEATQIPADLGRENPFLPQ